MRLLDNALFLHEIQDKFYSKFVKAIRDAGYKGPLVGSAWQAMAMVPHYYNLLSDYEVGYIDRHDYMDRVPDDTTLSQPGSGYLSDRLAAGGRSALWAVGMDHGLSRSLFCGRPGPGRRLRLGIAGMGCFL